MDRRKDRTAWTDSENENQTSNGRDGRRGFGVLALAFKEHVSDSNESSIMKNLVFAGLAGMMDAPRKQVNQSVYQLKRAGVQVVMITGDYQETAFSTQRGIARKREHRPENQMQ